MKTVPMTEICAPTQIPSDIQDRIYRHFKHRRICSEDDEFFVDEFQDKLLTVEHQFLELLRNELVEYDPMVAEYMERIITDKTSRKIGSTEGGNVDRSKSGTDTHSQSGEDTINGGLNREQTHARALKTTVARSTDYLGSENVAENASRNISKDITRNYTIDVTDGRTIGRDRSGQQSEVADSVDLQGATPDSQTYGAGSSIGLASPGPVTTEQAQPWPQISHEVGAPGKLDWKYTSGQSEAIRRGDRVDRGSEKEEQEGTRKEVQGGSGGETENGSEDATRKLSFENRQDVMDETQDLTGDESVRQVDSENRAMVYGKKVTDTFGSATTETRNLTRDQKEDGSSDRKEQYSGRHAAPPELLEKSRAFIIRSNAIKWLFGQLESVFYSILNPEGW